MNNTNKNNKLVGSAAGNNNNKKTKTWKDRYHRAVADAKTYAKFVKALKKYNKGLAEGYKIPQYKAVSEALNLWIEKND